MTNVDIRALASLARLDVSDAEIAKLEGELPAIIGFVEEIQNAATTKEASVPKLRNVVRADESPHESGMYTETLLSAAPNREGDRIAVKQVVSRKK